MNSKPYSTATHFSIVWGVALAIITLLEWNNLERNPVDQEIYSPFINRSIEVTVENAAAPGSELQIPVESEHAPDAALRYDVELTFNGPLFLAFFFIPVLIFNGVELLWHRLRGG